MEKANLCNMTVEEIFEIIKPSGFALSHATSIANSIYKKGISDIDRLPNISTKLKKVLADVAVTGLHSPVSSEISADNSIKFLYRSDDGKEYETVYIPEKKRHTVCVSTQSGCRMGCVFCATAKYGFHGNLSAGEIVNQVISLPVSPKITHVVFMGMGEPMDNLDNVLKATRLMTAEYGMAIASRNLTISTVGILPSVLRYLNESVCNLTISLFSPFSGQRSRFVPMEKAYPIIETLEKIGDIPLRKKRTITLAYVMIEDLNDTDDHLEALVAMLRGTHLRVNLLPYHNVPGDNNRSSSAERMQYFKHNLVISGISASIRKSRGLDISAACGLLASGLKN